MATEAGPPLDTVLCEAGITTAPYPHEDIPEQRPDGSFPLQVWAAHSDSGVLVYQAFRPEIVDYAVANQRFLGCEHYLNRMSWIKPQFSWMMFRSDWARSRNQEKIVGILLKRGFWEEVVRSATTKGGHLRLQWDPYHSLVPPYGKRPARAIQLGLKGEWLRRMASGEEVVAIVDMTPFVEAQRAAADAGEVERIVVPHECHMEGLMTTKGDSYVIPPPRVAPGAADADSIAGGESTEDAPPAGK